MSVLDYPYTLTTSSFSSAYGKSAIWLNKFLVKKGIIEKDEVLKRYYVKPPYNKMGLHEYVTQKVKGDYRYFIVWTLKGRKYIANLLEQDGLI